jgi:hypothetical protein
MNKKDSDLNGQNLGDINVVTFKTHRLAAFAPTLSYFFLPTWAENESASESGQCGTRTGSISASLLVIRAIKMVRLRLERDSNLAEFDSFLYSARRLAYNTEFTFRKYSHLHANMDAYNRLECNAVSCRITGYVI